MCLGLHLRTVDDPIYHARFAERARLWYSLYSLEVAISGALGKVASTCLAYSSVSVDLLEGPPCDEQWDYSASDDTRALWLDFLRRPRNNPRIMRGDRLAWQDIQYIGYGAPRQYLSSRARLSVIKNGITTELYLPCPSNTWAMTQEKIGRWHNQLLEWKENLTVSMKFPSNLALGGDPRAKIDLTLYYYSIQMILFRQCLCHPQLPSGSASSKEITFWNATNCVYAAASLMDVLPEDPTAHEAYQLLPCWDLLYYLGQALSVFTMRLCFNKEHGANSTVLMKPRIRKAMAYLLCLSASSLSAYKEWRIFRQLLLVLNSRGEDIDIKDIKMNVNIPIGWSVADEALLIEELRST